MGPFRPHEASDGGHDRDLLLSRDALHIVLRTNFVFSREFYEQLFNANRD